ncbi:LuxR C-terminal-related transcriptional regulator [Mesorhizobium sp. AR10]|uniref:helix-turn-helix transcriptional regulator n=1 Tax=Mesorhizobium sp. AR10 TaxID=2865839 RepID=UPI00215E1947|nr:LuxR C-terminal-related transcriptional regulator [Mesorhizobium sp. AR10]UVK40229.1 LuxR C-terminal-related transcriptional regulator [Mesorhizobium sp. AR10]
MISDDPETTERGQRSRSGAISLLLVGRDGFIPDCNIASVMNEFPLLAIHHAGTIAGSLAEFDPLPRAVLIQEACITEATELEMLLLGSHGSRIVVVVENAKQTSSAVLHVVANGLVHGILAMNLPLEIWLLAFRLLLRGGEFVPISVARLSLRPARNGAADIASGGLSPPTIAALTERELQVLEMVSMGCSNSVIALRFSLSENTIKVHVHNIISKLNARNRTAAAAKYLESTRKSAGATNVFPIRGPT